MSERRGHGRKSCWCVVSRSVYLSDSVFNSPNQAQSNDTAIWAGRQSMQSTLWGHGIDVRPTSTYVRFHY